jgi:hypothetical protein
VEAVVTGPGLEAVTAPKSSHNQLEVSAESCAEDRVIVGKSDAWYVRKISQFPGHNGKFNSQT